MIQEGVTMKIRFLGCLSLLLALVTHDRILGQGEAMEGTTLLDPGQAERRVLTYTPVFEATQRVHYRREKSMWMEWEDTTSGLDESNPRQHLVDPVINSIFEYKIKPPDSSIKGPAYAVDQNLVSFEVIPSTGQRSFLQPGTEDTPTEPAIRACLQSVVGLHLVSQFSPTGSVIKRANPPPNQTCDNLGIMRDQLDHAYRPVFPVEPVGIGASWEVQSSIKQDPDFLLPIKTIHTLEAFEDGRVTLRSKVEASKSAKNIKGVGVPEDGTTDLEEITIKGESLQVVDLARHEPVFGEFKTSAKMRMTIRRPVKDYEGKISMDIEFKKIFEEIVEQAPAQTN